MEKKLLPYFLERPDERESNHQMQQQISNQSLHVTKTNTLETNQQYVSNQSGQLH